MSEIFDIISAVNRLKDHVTFLTTRVDKLSDRVDDLSKYPPLIALNGLVDESVAAKYLHLSYRELRRMRSNGEIPFKKFHRKILYDVDDIRAYLNKTTIQPSLLSD
jgi:hypothetical protein